MRSISSGFVDELNNDNRSYLCYADMTLQDGTTLNFDNTNLWSGSFSFEDAVSSDNTFDIGSVIIGVLKFTINNIDESYSDYDFNGAKVTAYVGMELADGTIEKLRMGYYTVYETPKYNGAIISLECYDNLYMLDSDASESTLEYPATLMQIVQDACTNCGIMLGTTSFENSGYIVDEKPVEQGLTYRKLMSWVAQILCKWVRVNNSGQLVLEWYDMNTYEKLPETGSGAYTHIRYALDETGLGMTDKPSLWEANGRNYLLNTGTPTSMTGNNTANQYVKLCDLSVKPLNVFASVGDTLYFSADVEVAGERPSGTLRIQTANGRFCSFINGYQLSNGSTHVFKEWTLVSADMNDSLDRVNMRLDDVPETTTVTVKNVKLSFDDSPWTPAPEDYSSDWIQPYIGIATTDSPVAPADAGEYTWSPYNGVPVNLDAVHRIDSISSKQIYTDDVVITGIQVIEQLNTTDADNTETYLSGSEGYILSIEKNLLIQNGKGNTVASYVGEKLIGLRFRPYSLTCLGDIRIEAGDIVNIVDEKGRLYKSLVTSNHFGIGEYEKIACGAQSPERNSASRYSAETVAYVRLRQLIKKEQTAREQAIENLANQLSDSSGMFITVEPQPDGSSIYYMHNKPKLTDSNIVWKLTAEAFGISTDGGVTYPYGFAVTGEMITRLLYAEGIDADYINTGAIMIRDTNGNIIFSVNMDTGQVIISGDSVRIGDKSVEQAINDVSDEASQARTLQVSLSNDYQAVSTDADGGYTGLLNASTIVSAYYGHDDVSADCSYSCTKSSGVTGTWEPATRTYTVIGLWTSVDEGWVDITVTYLGVFTVTKRFNVSKVKNGADGQTYFLKSNESALKRTNKSLITTPNRIDYNASNSSGKAYAGRFYIEEKMYSKASRSTFWGRVYMSSNDESSVRYSPYTFFVDEEGNALYDANTGEGLGCSNDILEVRCSLYKAGQRPDFSTSELLDRQSAPVVIDTEPLTHSEVFNLLTGNGMIKGIYKEGNQLYINATYIKSGTLVLGGSDNQYGKLRILDEVGSEIGKWDKDGINVNGGRININQGIISSNSDGNVTGLDIYGGLMHTKYKNFEIGSIGVSAFSNGSGEILGLSENITDNWYNGNFISWNASVGGEDPSPKLLYAKTAFSGLNSDTLYAFCDLEMGANTIKNPVLDNVKIGRNLTVYNSTACDFYTNTDFHNYEISNARVVNLQVNNISAVGSIKPWSGVVTVVTGVTLSADRTTINVFGGQMGVLQGLIITAPGESV